MNRVIFAARGSAQWGLCTSRGYAAGAVLLVLFAVMPVTWAESAGQRLESIKEQPLLLRQFLQRMPKGVTCTTTCPVPFMQNLICDGQHKTASASIRAV